MFEVSILTPQKTVFTGRVKSLIVPAHDGYYGVMVNHAPFISLLKEGRITARAEDKEYQFSTTGGLMEVLANKVSILADSAEAT